MSQQTSPTALQEDGKNDWIPDALGYVDLPSMDRAATARARSLRPCGVPFDVPLADRRDTVWRLDPVWRAALNRTVDDCIKPAERLLGPAVYGNRDSATPYGIEYKRLLVDMRGLMANQQVAFVVVADIHRFSRSVTMGHLERLSGLSQQTLDLFAAIADEHGVPLVHGVRACSRVANLLLHPADGSIRVQFQRWADGYYLYADSYDAATTALGRLEERISELGFRFNPAKTRVLPVSDFAAKYAFDASSSSGPLIARLNTAIRNSDSRTLR